MDRRIGIIGDGQTDRRVIGKLAECTVRHGQETRDHPQIIELSRLNIRDAVDKYWREASSSKDYSAFGDAGKKLHGSVFAVLEGAIEEFRSLVGIESVTWRDVIVLSTDTERHYSSAERYFDPWAFQFPKILTAATERICYEFISRGHEPIYIPTIITLPLYPSTEVIIAAARGQGLSFHGKSANELKTMLYNERNLRALSIDEFKRQALDHITQDSLVPIFKQIPEIRPFVHALLYRV